jgi:two-component system sensor histidine kinase YesM
MGLRTKWLRFQNWGIRNKLLLSYFVVSIIPILIISLTVYQISSKSVTEASEEFASLYISQVTTNLEFFWDRHDKSTRSIIYERDIMDILGSETPFSMDQTIENRAVLQRFYSQMSEVYPEIETIMLVDVRGNIYHFTRAADTIDPSVLEQQAWYSRIRDTEHSMFVTAAHDKAYYSKDKSGVAFTIGRVLWDYDGSYSGMILFDMNPSNLVELSKDFMSIGNQYDVRLIITSGDDQLIFHSDAATGKTEWQQIIGNVVHAGSDDQINSDMIVLTREASDGVFQIITELPLDKLLARINNIERFTETAIFLCLLFIIFISTLFSSRITRPILDLRRNMKQVEMGHYELLKPSATSNDEIHELVISYNKMIQKNKELIEDVYIAEIRRKQAQFLALQSQINPHMLYNTLESIRMRAIVKNQDDIAEMIKRLARMFKHTLNTNIENNRIRHEVEYAANYLFLQNIRYDHRFILEVNLSESVLDTPIIPIVFQPIVENSIKHGFRDYSRPLTIRIDEIPISSDKKLIRITDNGVELPDEKLLEINCHLQSAVEEGNADLMDTDSSGGIGLRNIAYRIKMQYGNDYYIRIGAEKGIGTFVELLIPVQ